jgi:hypothetical protein
LVRKLNFTCREATSQTRKSKDNMIARHIVVMRLDLRRSPRVAHCGLMTCSMDFHSFSTLWLPHGFQPSLSLMDISIKSLEQACRDIMTRSLSYGQKPFKAPERRKPNCSRGWPYGRPRHSEGRCSVGLPNILEEVLTQTCHISDRTWVSSHSVQGRTRGDRIGFHNVCLSGTSARHKYSYWSCFTRLRPKGTLLVC